MIKYYLIVEITNQKQGFKKDKFKKPVGDTN